MKYNDLQQDAINSLAPKVLVTAPAGSGKTSTLVGAIKKYAEDNPGDRIVAITFTRKAALELQSRTFGIKVDSSTIHSWSLKELNRLGTKYKFKVSILQDDQIQEILQALSRKCGYYSMNYFMLFAYVMGNYNIDVAQSTKMKYEKVLRTYIQYKRENQLYDFTDLPLYLYDMLNKFDEEIETIDGLFVDEFQDVDDVQAKIFTKVKAKKFFFIGDTQQCQPAGTKVRLRGNIIKNIEDVQIGDDLVSYDPSQGYCTGPGKSNNMKHHYVTNTASRQLIEDYLFTITTETGLQSSYTGNHRTYVKLNYLENKHVVYLMCDSNYRFRIGKIPLCASPSSKDTGNPWRKKLKDEGCEKIWLLSIHDSDKEACVEEAKLSYQYGIPQTCFQTTKVRWTVEDLDYIYKDLDIVKRANDCLNDHKLNIDYPLLDLSIDWSAKNHCTTNSTIEIYAQNIIPNYMSCVVYGSESSNRNKHFENIVNVNKKYIVDPIMVYSLDVDGGTYVADEIVTHNCIYIFRGAGPQNLKSLTDFEHHTLNINYRSYQGIIDYANTMRVGNQLISNTIKTKPCNIICARTDEDGEVYVVEDECYCHDAIHGYIKDTYQTLTAFLLKKPYILCRSNKQVKAIESLGYKNVSTIHQAKGLEYTNVIVTDMELNSEEEINIAYVACTRAQNGLLICDSDTLYMMMNEILYEYRDEICGGKLF